MAQRIVIESSIHLLLGIFLGWLAIRWLNRPDKRREMAGAIALVLAFQLCVYGGCNLAVALVGGDPPGGDDRDVEVQDISH